MDSPGPHDPLSATLQHWRVAPARAPGFRPAVWRRIAQRSRDTWTGYVQAHRLAWSVAAVAVVGVAGWTGHAAAQARLAAERDAMVTAYLVELDPRVQAGLRP
jgi:hypothetical protein